MAILRPCNNCPVSQGVAYNSHTVQWCVVLYVSTVFTQVGCFTITASINPTGILVLGSNTFNLTCEIDNEGADVFGMVLARKRESDYDYVDIVSFPPPNLDRNVTYLDRSLETRTTPVRAVTLSLRASLNFNDTVCTDKASYRWTVKYFDTQQRTATAITNIGSLKALSTFRDDGQVSYFPVSNLQEGDEVIFTCQGNVGNMPIAELLWYVYRHGATSNGEMQINGITTNPPTVEVGNPCSFRRSSVLRLTMTSDMDGAAIRCTMQQDVKTEFRGNNDNYKQTGKLSVMYSPRNLVIDMRPAGNDGVYDEGTELLTLTCSAVSKPAPSYYWIVSAISPTATFAGAVFQLRSLTLKDTGVYICVAQNSINGKNYSANSSVSITVDRDECATGTAECDQNCQNTQSGYTCSCRDGYTLNDNGVTCDDVDECMLGIAVCAQSCWNTAGSFKCSCRDGFIGYDDGKTCDAPPASDGTSTGAPTGVAVAGWTVAALLAVGIGLVVWRRRESLFPGPISFIGKKRGKKTVAESRELRQPEELQVVMEGTQSYDLVQTQADGSTRPPYENSGTSAPYESLQRREEGATYDALQLSGHPATGYQNLRLKPV